MVLHVFECPHCRGQKTTSKPPWVVGDQETWVTSDTNLYPCPTCDGKGYLLIDNETRDNY